jgi:hypothetical protein
MTVAILTNFSRLLRREEVLSPSDRFNNPIKAFLGFQMAYTGMHTRLRNAAAIARDFFKEEQVNALSD